MWCSCVQFHCIIPPRTTRGKERQYLYYICPRPGGARQSIDGLCRKRGDQPKTKLDGVCVFLFVLIERVRSLFSQFLQGSSYVVRTYNQPRVWTISVVTDRHTRRSAQRDSTKETIWSPQVDTNGYNSRGDAEGKTTTERCSFHLVIGLALLSQSSHRGKVTAEFRCPQEAHCQGWAFSRWD